MAPAAPDHRSSRTVEPRDRPYYRAGDRIPKQRPRALVPIVACLVAIACATGLWFAYSKLRTAAPGPDGIPLIHADQGATKVKPANPGGEALTDEGKDVYAMGAPAPKTERLLPPPETPLPKPAPVQAQEEAPAAPPMTPAPAAPAETRSNTVPQEVTGPAAQSATAPTLTEPGHQPPPTPPAIVSKPAPPPPVAAPPAATPPARQVAAAAPPAPAPSGLPGSFRVQIAATKDEPTARSEWGRLQKSHPDLLGNLGLTVVKADLGERGTFYRLQAGPLPDRAQAEKLCTQLKALSIGCIVVKQ